MKNYIICLFFLISILLFIVPAGAVKEQNPFTGQKDTVESTTGRDSHPSLMHRLNILQNQTREKISSLVAESKETRSLRPLSALILFSFLYGMLHAAGPGHGKAVAVSYVLSDRPSFLKGLALGNMIAIFHGSGGIVFVIIVYGLLHAGITRSMSTVNHITQIASYSLIILLGLYLLTEAFLKWRRTNHNLLKENLSTTAGKNISAAFAIGLIPCPGVIMVTFLAVSMGLPGLGILLGICIALGMAVTISIVVVAGVAGEKALINRLESHPRWIPKIEISIRFISGLLVAGLGILMFFSY